MKSNIFKYLIIFLAIGSIATECTEELVPDSQKILINASFHIIPETGPTNSTFTFIINNAVWGYESDEELNYDIEEFQWDFDYTGGGVYSFDTEVISEKTITHIYTVPGTYTVILKATVQDEDAVIYLEKELIVTGSTNTPPIAAFESNPTSGTAPLTVYFTDQSTNDPTSWLWDFGNGESSSEQNPSHTYDDVGTYTVKLTATNDHGSDDEEKVDYITVTYGSNACPGAPTVTDFEGNQYNTVLIGDQCWMKENLKTTSYDDGSPIPNVSDWYEWYWVTTGAYVWYENDDTWKNKYGALYNWSAVVNPGGLCPSGWHVPTKDELLELNDFIGGTSQDGIKIKSCRQVNSTLGEDCNTNEHPRWNESNPYYHGTDNYGFSGLPGGHRPYYNNCEFSGLGVTGFWWSSTHTPSSQYSAYYFTLNHEGNASWFYDASSKNGYSVRCLKND